MAGVLAEIEHKLDGLQVEKEAFREVEEIEMKKKACQKALYSGKAQRNDQQINELKGKRRLVMEERETLLDQREAQLDKSGSSETNIAEGR